MSVTRKSRPAQPAVESLIDPTALMRIESLELRARAVVEGMWRGLHRSPYHGFSVEFTEYRQYVDGDDPRYLDWRLYARCDRHFIKKYEDETNFRCHLILDQSRSMDYGSAGVTKSAYAATLAATLAYFLNQKGDAVGLVTFASQVTQLLPPRNRPGHLRQLFLALSRAADGEQTDVHRPLAHVASLLQKRGMIVLLSDLLCPLDQFSEHLGYLRTRGHDVVMFQILDPAEKNLALGEATLLRDLESGRELHIDPHELRNEYREKLNAHLAQAEAACVEHGVDYHLLTTDRPLELALYDFLAHRQGQRRVLRATSTRGRGAR